jgi:hypothetical protein
MRTFGGDTLTFVITVGEDLNDRDVLGNPAQIRTEVDVPGCRFRPLPATETVADGTTVVRGHWRATCPPHPAVLAAKSQDEIEVDGTILQIVGEPRVFSDKAGAPFKVSVICERQVG